jgi:hypothetical protein
LTAYIAVNADRAGYLTRRAALTRTFAVNAGRDAPGSDESRR